jgi:hypothetical protein
MPQQDYRFTAWFLANWSRAGLPAGAILLALSPLLFAWLPLPVFLIYFQLPIYMLHQYEEHAHGAFQAYINRELAGGKDALTLPAIFWINVLCVWALDLAVLYLAAGVSLWLGLIAIYLPLVNAVIHIVMALVKRQYNPGLWTSLVLFLPVGGYALARVAQAAHASFGAHAASLGVALLIHAAMVVAIQVRIRHLKAIPAPVRS